ncbi:hypothetical protein AB205_0138520 [Aquarana catesbeiana]|uniref:Uncharacterized protein n=1 Tax=Aquarana catesbeiana TaxID=8400 RepID=A0A2G9RMF9_AQUCT|nr:hypothetical protein AB205_0138520 [Aquarana catesbeiana]
MKAWVCICQRTYLCIRAHRALITFKLAKMRPPVPKICWIGNAVGPNWFAVQILPARILLCRELCEDKNELDFRPLQYLKIHFIF